MVFTHTVLEHVFEMNVAFKIMSLLSKKYIIGVVPMINVVHWENNTYKDFWRFTPHGIEQLLNNCNFKLIHLSIGPKNDIYKYILFVGLRNSAKETGEFKNLSIADFQSGHIGLISILNIIRTLIFRLIYKFRII